MKRPIFLLLALGLSLPGNGRVRLPSLVGSGMVLQRNSDARIWGGARNRLRSGPTDRAGGASGSKLPTREAPIR